MYQVRASRVKLTANKAGCRRARRMITLCRVVRVNRRDAAMKREELLGILQRPQQRKRCGVGDGGTDGGELEPPSSRLAAYHS